MHAARDSRSREVTEQQFNDGMGGKLRDEPWRPEGGRDIQVDKWFVPKRVGGRTGYKREKWRGVEW